MTKQLSRRNMLGQAGLALGGLVTLGALQGCGEEDTDCPVAQECPPVDTSPTVAQFPYQQHLTAGYELNVAAVKEAAYQAYFAGGCCHGSFNALISHLAATAGAPFDKFPADFGKFGGGGMGYGSVCGSALGGVMIFNLVVSDATARGAMITSLLRWYETAAFPAFTPATVHANESGKTLDFDQSNLANIQTVSGSHLCHASLSVFANANDVAADGKDKHARCSRLTADVAGKVAEMLNQYLAATPNAYPALPRDSESAGCVGCHSTSATTMPAVNTGMSCTTCHPAHPL